MTTIVGRRQRVGIREISTQVTVPDNDRAKLMYYLSCMGSVLDLSNVRGLQRLMDYKSCGRLEREEEAELLALCIALNPVDLEAMPEHISGLRNRFIEVSSTETNFIASSTLFIAGRQRKVTKIMLYKPSWIRDNYHEPLQRMTNGLGEGKATCGYTDESGCCSIL